MSLQVWLPLNKNVIENKGLSDIVCTNNGATFVDSGIESCYSFTTTQYMELTNINFSKLKHSSISFWFKVNKNDNLILPFSGQSTGYYMMASSTGAATPDFFYSNVGGTKSVYQDGIYVTAPTRDGEWHHYCLVDADISSWTKIRINKFDGNWEWNGQMSNVRIYDHVLSEKEIHELSKGLMFHLKLDNTDLYDCSGYGWDVSSNNTLAENSDTARYSKSLYFDGNTAINIGNIMTNSSFTFNCWFYVKEFGKSWATIFGGPSGFELETRLRATTNAYIHPYSWGGGGTDTPNDYSIAYELNKWNMVTMVRTTTGTRFYLNGEFKVAGSAGSVPSGNYFIGAWRTATEQNFKGNISDVRIYRTALTDEQVRELYKVGGSIDNHGNAHCYELNECENKNIDKLLRFKSNGNSTIGLSSLSSNQTVEYSFNYDEWIPLTTTSTINLSNNQTVYVRGKLTNNNTSSNYTQFNMSGSLECNGNINYLWDYENLDAPLKQYCGYLLFNNCTSLTKAPELPAMDMAEHCYEGMFRGCIGLSSAPELPAPTLANLCYRNMFRGCSALIYPSVLPAINLNNASRCYYGMYAQCTSLTTAPELPASTLANYCYYDMFGGCTSLTTAPILKADVLAAGCYNSMFADCTNLNYIKCLATDISATDCTTNWVNNVASSGTFIKMNDDVEWTTGINGIPVNWQLVAIGGLIFKSTGNSTLGLNSKSSYQTIQYSADGDTWNNMTTSTNLSLSDGLEVYVRGKLTGNNDTGNYTLFKMTGSLECNGNINYLWDYENPNAALKEYCGYRLFANCSALTKGPKLSATQLSNRCYYYMFLYCSNLTNLQGNLPATTLTQYCYAYMFEGCYKLTTSPDILATTAADYSCYWMFHDCTRLVNVQEELPTMTVAPHCFQYMYYGCTSIVTAPILPAKTLAVSCYEGMFYRCNSLTYIRCMATNISASNCVYALVGDGIGLPGTFVKDPSMNSFGRGWAGPIYNYWDIANYYENPDVEFVPDTTFSNNNAVKLEVKEDNSIIWIPILCTYLTLYLSKDKQNWMTLHDGNRITVLNGETYYICGTLTAAHNRNNYTNIRLLGKIDASGNINTIFNYTNPDAALFNCCANQLFSLSTGLENVGLTLPSMTVPSTAYWQMFFGCTRMTIAPELPATTIIGDCYYLMFNYCTSLIQTPSILPATTITNYCYTDMFANCTSLVTVPKGLLPALEVKEASYSSMFAGCTSLTSAPDLPATTFTNTRQYSNMFLNCTSLTTAPELPALTLTNQCYQNMFNGCTNLSYIKCLATNISASSCLSNWTSGVSSTGTFVKDSTMTSWSTGTSGIPTNWTVQDVQ